MRIYSARKAQHHPGLGREDDGPDLAILCALAVVSHNSMCHTERFEQFLNACELLHEAIGTEEVRKSRDVVTSSPLAPHRLCCSTTHGTNEMLPWQGNHIITDDYITKCGVGTVFAPVRARRAGDAVVCRKWKQISLAAGCYANLGLAV